MDSDLDLINRYRASGDRKALEVLFLRYLPSVHRLARHILRREHEAEDVTQSTFAAVLQGLDGLRSDDRFAPWIFGIAVRLARKNIRSTDAESRRRAALEVRGWHPGVELPMSRSEVEAILDAVDELPEEYRLPILLHHCHGLSYDDVGRALSMPRGTVGTNIHRGLEKVRGALIGSLPAGVVVAILNALDAKEAPAHVVEAVSGVARSASPPLLGTPPSQWRGTVRMKGFVGIAAGVGILALLSIARRDSRSGDPPGLATRLSSRSAPVDPLLQSQEIDSRSLGENARAPAASPTPAIGESWSFNERTASALLKLLSTAEADFRANDRDGNGVQDYWTGDVSGLYLLEEGAKPAQVLALIPCELAMADAAPLGGRGSRGPLNPRAPYDGYWYRMLPVASASGGRSAKEFAIVAYPSEYGVSGRKTFLVNQDNDVVWKDLQGEPPATWPTEGERGTWGNVEEEKELPRNATEGASEFSERMQAEMARYGFDTRDLNDQQIWVHRANKLVSLQEFLGLDADRWAALRTLHDRLLESARSLERERAGTRQEEEKTIIDIPAFPQDGLTLVAEWKRGLGSLLPPEKQREFDLLWGDSVFPLGLGQRPIRITVERFGELTRVEEHATLASGEIRVSTSLVNHDELPAWCKHLIR